MELICKGLRRKEIGKLCNLKGQDLTSLLKDGVRTGVLVRELAYPPEAYQTSDPSQTLRRETLYHAAASTGDLFDESQVSVSARRPRP